MSKEDKKNGKKNIKRGKSKQTKKRGRNKRKHQRKRWPLYLLECEIVERMISISPVGNPPLQTYRVRVRPTTIFRKTSLIVNSRNYGIAVEEDTRGSFKMAIPPVLRAIRVNDDLIAELPVDTNNLHLTSAISGWQSGLAVLELDVRNNNTVIGIKKQF